MHKTIVAVFDAKQDAQSTLEALASEGFSTRQARLKSTDDGGVTGSTTSSREGESATGDKVSNLFGFGYEDETYTEAVRRGGYLVTVDVADEDDADLVVSLMERFGPVDVGQRAADWRASGWQPKSVRLRQDTNLVRARSGMDYVGNVIAITKEQLVVGKRKV